MPLKEKKKLDVEKLYSLSCGKNGVNPIQFWELTPFELMLIDEGRQEHYEIIKAAFQVGYVSAKKGKNYELFRKPGMQKVSSERAEELENEFDSMDE
ncbi:hypothetical protein [Gottfriedia acidiceleris]|uniref:hypothetical protein n=1 Tax=Gottfriedia acidiceleris TaxID=371036 RepID=UPI00101B9FE0|nr:hypothetical protein [Gottfriedia acidiceleris]